MMTLIIFSGGFILICLILFLYKVNILLHKNNQIQLETVQQQFEEINRLKNLPPKTIIEYKYHPYEIIGTHVNVDKILSEEHREHVAKTLYYNIAESLWKQNKIDISINKQEGTESYKIEGKLKVITDGTNN